MAPFFAATDSWTSTVCGRRGAGHLRADVRLRARALIASTAPRVTSSKFQHAVERNGSNARPRRSLAILRTWKAPRSHRMYRSLCLRGGEKRTAVRHRGEFHTAIRQLSPSYDLRPLFARTVAPRTGSWVSRRYRPDGGCIRALVRVQQNESEFHRQGMREHGALSHREAPAESTLQTSLTRAGWTRAWDRGVTRTSKKTGPFPTAARWWRHRVS